MDRPESPFRRTDDEVLAAARAMDFALAAGLPHPVLATILAARSAWWGDGPWPREHELVAVLLDPRARAVDEVVFAAIKQRVRRGSAHPDMTG